MRPPSPPRAKLAPPVAAQLVTDTIKEPLTAKSFRGPDRLELWSVQTPQTFRLEVIRHAIATARQKGLNPTDDTAARIDQQAVQLVKSTLPNPKVTVLRGSTLR